MGNTEEELDPESQDALNKLNRVFEGIDDPKVLNNDDFLNKQILQKTLDRVFKVIQNTTDPTVFSEDTATVRFTDAQEDAISNFFLETSKSKSLVT